VHFYADGPSAPFWAEHFTRHGIAHGTARERFGQKLMHFTHPAGLGFDLIEDEADTTEGWTTSEISADVAVRGFHSVMMSVRDTEAQEHFLIEGLGFSKFASDGPHTRLVINGGGAQRTIDLIHEPDLPQGSWHFAQGIVHHVAFAVPTEKEQTELKAHLEGLGYTDCSEIKDRNYFHSVYVRSPGGVLCEIATCDIGFGIDESLDHLGEKLLLPPWFESRRAEIVAPLEPIVVPAHAGA
jgi:glyoxalase family protein